MCLDSTERIRTICRENEIKIENGKMVGYKIMRWNTDRLMSQIYNYNFSQPLPYNKWLTAKNMASSEKTIYSINGHRYRIGFHVFMNQDDALGYLCSCNNSKNFRVVKVYIKEICAAGFQNEIPILITKKMLIPSPQILLTRSGRKVNNI